MMCIVERLIDKEVDFFTSFLSDGILVVSLTCAEVEK